MYRFTRAAACACVLTAAFATSGCGSSDSPSVDNEEAVSLNAPGEDGPPPTTTEKTLDRRAQKVEDVTTCLTNKGSEVRTSTPQKMNVPNDIKAKVAASGAAVLHVPAKKGGAGGADAPAIDVLINPDVTTGDSEFSDLVLAWLDKRAGIDPNQSAGTMPSSDIPAPTGPSGFYNGPTIEGVSTIGYDIAPRAFVNIMEGCGTINKDSTL